MEIIKLNYNQYFEILLNASFKTHLKLTSILLHDNKILTISTSELITAKNKGVLLKEY